MGLIWKIDEEIANADEIKKVEAEVKAHKDKCPKKCIIELDEEFGDLEVLPTPQDDPQKGIKAWQCVACGKKWKVAVKK